MFFKLSSKKVPAVDDYYALKNKLIDHEGVESSAYQDSKGYWTIGVGRLIDSRRGGKLSDEEMLYLLDNDIKNAIKDLSRYSWFRTQDKVRQDVLIELVFSMGIGSLRNFKKMIAALKVYDYTKAAVELIDSKWAREDVSSTRSKNVKFRLEYGRYT